MPAFVMAILSALGLVAQDLPQIEAAISGFWTFVSGEFAKIFGSNAAATMTGVVTQAEGLVTDLDNGVTDAEAWLKSQAPTIDALLAMFPGLANSLYSRYTVMADNPGVTHAMAAKVVEAAHANIRVKQP